MTNNNGVSARVGKCLFIREDLYEPILKFSSGGLKYSQGDPIDLAAYEGYIALPCLIARILML